MNRIKWMLALLGMTLCAASFAEEPSLCKSLCSSSKKECRADVKSQVELDRDGLLQVDSKNPFQRANERGAVATADDRVREQDDTRHRIAERNGQCDTTYLRCVRACDAPPPTGTDSVILKRKPEAKTGDRS